MPAQQQRPGRVLRQRLDGFGFSNAARDNRRRIRRFFII
jgi:hypothetical protein